MVDITAKSNTLRIATAEALVEVSSPKTIEAIREHRVPKGDAFEMSRAAGLLGVKKTPELLPDCHPIPIEYTGFHFEIVDQTIKISCTIKTIYKTGVEVEAMHGASIAAKIAVPTIDNDIGNVERDLIGLILVPIIPLKKTVTGATENANALLANSNHTFLFI